MFVYSYLDGITFQCDEQNYGLVENVVAIALDKERKKWTVGSGDIHTINSAQATKMQLLNEDLTPFEHVAFSNICIDQFDRIFITRYLDEIY